MEYRQEIKYLINYIDAKAIRNKIRTIMKSDIHSINGAYQVRSIYLDDYWNSAYVKKVNGYTDRKKYRIRLYNCDNSYICLECKIKRQDYIKKLSVQITKEEAEKIINGDFEFLLHHSTPLCRQLYYECVSNVLRPTVIVEYEREAFVYTDGNVRITFDSDVRAAYPSSCMSENISFFGALEPGKLILEVKFSEFLPDIIRKLLPIQAAEYSSASKYVLCCNKINYLSAERFNQA